MQNFSNVRFPVFHFLFPVPHSLSDRAASNGLNPEGTILLMTINTNCDPLGLNQNNGGQIFAVRPDGRGLRQLTDARGLVMEGTGTISGDLPGPWSYGPYLP